MLIDYGSPGVFTTLAPAQVPLFDDLPPTPAAICGVVQGLVVQPHDGPASRAGERNLRPAAAMVDALTALSPAPLSARRPVSQRTVGTCRNFVVLAVALLRLRGVPARARCGFGTYFHDGVGLDHWVLEYWSDDERRWVRTDAEWLGTDTVPDAADLAPGRFLTGGEAWQRWRKGEIDATKFGVWGTSHAWGEAEIRGNAIRDLAALMRVETLPWDEWGRMEASYQGKTGPDYDELIDEVAATCAGDDPAAVATLYATPELSVPPSIIETA